ncbi:Ribosomal RNA small subunit methyltransferase D [Candidatus Portiera aleyrodidarum]|uniref:Ribosomal RNA small subunit methyltransferase D n=1 Tax=Candidatus Portiera aleyrodidarum TaxID=91844 RepID=A0A6S6RY44_9GAMM|nr:16S rRNA (guanine(966)-N(2))-methyltransferase RsmD [Candidatus Portiera aleyrodidarum]CAA3704615.1 Ribosomal RNA small subunit methyltransferase D [Candidatus Portiera aleyrodidarum]
MINYFIMIRIIGGSKKRSILSFPSITMSGVRPTISNARDTLFNWIANDIKNKNILDLYAGSGCLGFETLSRGAKHVYFVENKKYLVKNLYINKNKLKLLNSVNIIKTNSINYINNLAFKSFDIIFIDPPFYKGLVYPSINLLESNGWLNNNSFIYLEVEAKLDLFFIPNTWILYKELSFGKSHIFLYRRFLKNTTTHQRKKQYISN